MVYSGDMSDLDRAYYVDALRDAAQRHAHNHPSNRGLLAEAIRDAKNAGVPDADIAAVVLEESAKPLTSLDIA